ncbi:MAG: menaquinone biosynthesis protein [Bacteroidetes bacterium]|nr:menaquinone biosynthesis protein [Bacteroidota bacterium]
MNSTRRIGAAWFLNTKPLIYGFETDPELKKQVTLLYGIPAQNEVQLFNGEADIALVPSIEYARHASRYELIPGGCISSDSAVNSVILFFNKNLDGIKRIAIDQSSRTSVVLLKILMSEKYGITPEYVVMEPDFDKMLQECDAALLIGNNALQGILRSSSYLDLAEEWIDMTQLPFVFAVWAGNRGKVLPGDISLLDKSRKIGMENIQVIAAQFAKEHGWNAPDSFFEDYLTEHVKFELTPERMEGLFEFFRLAYMLGYLDSFPDIRKTGEEVSLYTPSQN